MKQKTITEGDVLDVLSVADAKTHLRITHSNDDSYIAALISAAVQYAEEYTGRALRAKTLEAIFPRFPASWDSPLVLPNAPVSAITSIKYYDPTFTQQTLDPSLYWLDEYARPLATIYSDPDALWPASVEHPQAVTVRYVCGYDAALSDPNFALPPMVVHAVKIIVAELYNVRADTIFDVSVQKMRAIERLLFPWRTRWAI